MKHHDPNDKTATHFIARKNAITDGFFITLYRFKEPYPAYGQTECNCTKELKERGSICHYCMNEKLKERPQYKGPMGWQFHSQQNDTDVIKEMHTIDKLPAITGDDLTKGIFNQNSMYAG